MLCFEMSLCSLDSINKLILTLISFLPIRIISFNEIPPCSTQNVVVKTSRYGFTVGQDVHVLGKDGERHACRILKVVQPSGGESMCTVRKIFQPSKDYEETIPESKIVGWTKIVEQ